MKPNSRTVRLALLLCCVAAAAASARADVKIKSKTTSGGQTTESVVYIKGKRQRSEYGQAVSIMQCDLRRSLQLVVPAKTYTVTPFGGDDAAGGAASSTKAAAGQPAATTRGGVVTTTYTSTDTGERKQMFGYTARRIKTTMVTESSPDACNPGRSRMESDGWYIDAAFALDCNVQGYGGYTPPAAAGGCRDTYRTKQAGTAKPGYPVLVTTSIMDEAGKPSFTFTQEVVEISKAVLDASLFEAPADFREVSDSQALYAATPAGASPSTGDEGDADENREGDGPNVGASPAAPASAAGPKRAGVVRVGVAVTRAASAGNVSAASLAEALREGFAGQLTGPSVEVTPLASELPQQIEEEARRKQCDYVLYTAATHKKGGGGGLGGFLKKAAPVVVAGGGESSGAAGGFKSKDELTLEYTLQRTGASTLAASATLKAKAKSDGEDLVGQLVTQAAPAVAAELKK